MAAPGSMPARTSMPMLNGRPDYALIDALKKVSPQAQLKAKGAAQDGLDWHLARPPVVGLEYEMDVRTVAREVLL